jgi:hypothetical protein
LSVVFGSISRHDWASCACTINASIFSFPILKQSFKTLTELKNTIFWDAIPCSPIEFHLCLVRTYYIYFQNQRVCQARNQKEAAGKESGLLLGLLFNPEDEGSMFLRNFGELLPDYIAIHPRR